MGTLKVKMSFLSLEPYYSQQPNEPDKWFNRFTRYYLHCYDIKGDRSLLDSYNWEKQELARRKGKEYKRAANYPDDWKQAYKDYEWDKRAQEWDKERLEKQREGELTSLEGFRRNSVTDYQLTQSYARNMLRRHQQFITQHPIENLSVQDYAKLVNASRTVILCFKEALDIGAKALGVEEVIANVKEE